MVDFVFWQTHDLFGCWSPCCGIFVGLLWVPKQKWAALLALYRNMCDVNSLRFSYGAAPVNLLMTRPVSAQVEFLILLWIVRSKHVLRNMAIHNRLPCHVLRRIDLHVSCWNVTNNVRPHHSNYWGGRHTAAQRKVDFMFPCDLADPILNVSTCLGRCIFRSFYFYLSNWTDVSVRLLLHVTYTEL